MKKALSLSLALVLALSMSTAAFAADATNDAADGHTTVGIQVYDFDPEDIAGSLNYEVPLYVTLAVAKDGTGSKVIVPDGMNEKPYGITNKNGGSDIGVTALNIASPTGAEWSLSQKVPTAKNTIQITLGAGKSHALVLPDMTVGTSMTTPITSGGFIDPVTPTPIKPTETLDLSLGAQIATNLAYDAAALAPQFKLTYTLAPLDKDGNVINAANVTYIGDNNPGL